MNLKYKIPSKEEYPEVMEAIYHFFIEGLSHQLTPGMKSTDGFGYPDGLTSSFHERYEKFLVDNVSVIAQDESKNNKIVGVVVSTLVTR